MSVNPFPGYGHPDFSAPLQVLDGPLTQWDSDVPAFSTVIVATINTIGYEYVGLYLANGSVAQTPTCYWSVNGKYGFLPQIDDYVSIPAGAFNSYFFLTAKAQLLTVAITDTSRADNNSQGSCWPTNRRPWNPNVNGNVVWSAGGGNPLVPGWNYEPLNITSGGQAIISAQTTGTYDIEVDYLDLNGTWDYIWGNSGFAANESMSQLLALPAGYCRIGVNNTSGANQSGTAAITSIQNVSGP